MIRREVESAVEFATSNEDAIKESEMFGCYYCLKTYPSSEVNQFLESERTALCPMCRIDSVPPSNSPYELSLKILRELNR